MTTLDFDATYTVDGYKGIAWRILRYAYMDPQDADGDEAVEDPDWVICIMVGDDRKHQIEATDLTVIDEDDYCHECGQIGCGHDGRERLA